MKYLLVSMQIISVGSVVIIVVVMLMLYFLILVVMFIRLFRVMVIGCELLLVNIMLNRKLFQIWVNCQIRQIIMMGVDIGSRMCRKMVKKLVLFRCVVLIRVFGIVMKQLWKNSVVKVRLQIMWISIRLLVVLVRLSLLRVKDIGRRIIWNGRKQLNNSVLKNSWELWKCYIDSMQLFNVLMKVEISMLGMVISIEFQKNVLMLFQVLSQLMMVKVLGSDSRLLVWMLFGVLKLVSSIISSGIR